MSKNNSKNITHLYSSVKDAIVFVLSIRIINFFYFTKPCVTIQKQNETKMRARYIADGCDNNRKKKKRQIETKDSKYG